MVVLTIKKGLYFIKNIKEYIMTAEKFIIQGEYIYDEYVYWSNIDGWTDKSQATEFSYTEKINLPIGARKIVPVKSH